MTVDFAPFKAELDDHQDRRERIIKISRDITALSKKIIFALHRIPILPIQQPQDAISPQIASEIKKLETQIQDLSDKAKPDLLGYNTWRYQRNISPAVQEFVEALSFRWYIQYQTVPTFSETQSLVGEIELTVSDYILGLADLTGELARRAITAIATETSEALNFTKRISTTLRQLCMQYELLDARGDAQYRDLPKKIEVMRSSVNKVEVAVFQKSVRR